ncbi:MAG TPA: M15 family metallopeptidase [Nocardioidaceae bacterium]|nr:M15 family metallopeptidase [Nocardioidaceae bacterium]
MSVARRGSLGARWLLVSVAFAIGACSSSADTYPDAGGWSLGAGDGPTSSTHGLRSDGPSDGPTPAAYEASIRRIGGELRSRMRFSHHAGCPVRWKDLRYLRMTYVDFDGNARTGELVVNKTFAVAVTKIFERLYEARWPIARMRLVDDYRGIDRRSMAANNTSGYNCRHVAGTRDWSAHAYGAAIDINPVQNPYLTESSTEPPAGRRYAAIDRSTDAHVPPGAIRAGDVVIRAFAGIGWEWGGDWVTAKDFQHFSAAEV